MKDKSILISMGIIIYIVMSGIDRFVYHIPNVIYIPVAILGIALILIGFFCKKDISVKWLRTSFGVRIAVYLQGNAVMQCNVERRIVMRRDYAVFPLWCECR